ncbi:hypothetical protein Gotur_009958 [Gossypium turneri]
MKWVVVGNYLGILTMVLTSWLNFSL